MSYGSAAALQSAVYQRLVGDPGLVALVGGAIYDALPAGTLPSLYVSLGGEEVKARDEFTGGGAVHLLKLSVVSAASGFASAKEAASAVCDALDDPALSLTRGRLVSLRFVRAKAAMVGNGQTRRIDMTFRARVDET